MKGVVTINCKHLKIRTKKGTYYKYCSILRKIITNECCNCLNKEYKNYKKLSTKKVYKINKKNSKIRKLEKNRKSIFTSNLDYCIICGKKKDNLHEIIYGKNRLNSMKYGFVIPLCFDHHIGNNGIHYNKNLDLYFKKKCQLYFENNIGNRTDFIETFGKNYL